MTEVMTPLAASAPEQKTEESQQPTYHFKFSDFLRREYRFGLNPDRPVCKAYLQGHCPDGNRCPNKHNVSTSYNKYVVQLIIHVYCSR
jgi:cleavage and polyadenylation specificity factor subunit 4